MRKSSNDAKNIKLKRYWADESRREVARQRTLAFWESKRGKKLKKRMPNPYSNYTKLLFCAIKNLTYLSTFVNFNI